jgi:hypothetical protein
VLIHPPRLELALAVGAAAVVSMITGVGIAILVPPGFRGSLLLVVVAAQLILCGGLFPVHEVPVLNWLSLLSPSRWSYAMGAGTVNLSVLGGAGMADPLWRHDPSHWLGALGGCAAVALAATIIVTVLLARLEPSRLLRP